MSTEVTQAAPQPEAPAQTSGEEKRADNLTMDEATAKLLKQYKSKPEAVPADQTITEAPEAEEGAPPAAEEQQSTSAEAKPEETEAETQEPTEPTEEAEDDLSKSTQLDAKTQERINRRIGKEVAKRKALEGQLNEIKAQMLEIQQAKPETPQPQVQQGPLPLENIQDVQTLQKRASDADAAIDFCERALDVIEDGGQIEGWTKQALKEAMRNAQREKSKDIPARYQFLQARHQASQKAFEQFPFLRDKKSNEYLVAQQVLAQHPYLNNDPRRDLFVGIQVMGLKALYAQQEAAKKAAEKKPIQTAKPSSDQTAVSSGGGGSRVPASTKANQVLAKATAELKQKGNATAADTTAFLLQRQLARNAR